ncbi:diguanylate phosphodiesterase [Noviherbaspirillum denitrificans]|uniref:Diguanylate phosphodiesterase n=2 Tax=Noviherbaspirillum denitrificans TaxID=1968433 RepID=A0A254TK14_9BURK|nr:diguanylate phosphodiesterase [Noviherbaspirillum denitrificans]
MDNLARDFIFENPVHAHRARDFFLARQPILDRKQQLFAYELLFREAGADAANVTDDLSATASVIAHAAELGMGNVIGSSLGFINVDAAVLLSDFIYFLPRDKVVLEILETVEVDGRIVARVEELAAEGYAIALDDVVAESSNVRKLLGLADIIKVDISLIGEERIASLARKFKRAGKRLLAEKVETHAQFRHCLEQDFDYFQGYYFARPTILAGRKLKPSQIAIMRLITQLASDAELTAIESSIKHDASLGMSLLRLVNAPGAGVPEQIHSLGQAMKVLGRQQIQRWLQILLYAESEKEKTAASPLLALSTTRGRLLELIADAIRPGDRRIAGIAFTVGILSLMDALFGLPMEEILRHLAVATEVRDALLERRGIYGDMLWLAECIENIDTSCPHLTPLLDRLGLSVEQLTALQVAAFEWSDAVASSP